LSLHLQFSHYQNLYFSLPSSTIIHLRDESEKRVIGENSTIAAEIVVVFAGVE
jgi:hypothetical protein